MRYLFPALAGIWQKAFSGAFPGINPLVLAVICGALCALIGYFLGSANTAIIVSRSLFKADIRKFGSGNAGMTNMFRVFGKKGGFLTLAGDAVKTFLALFLSFLLFGEYGEYLAGLACIVGHSFPVYYQFHGGKGVVTSAVTILLTDPLVFLALVLIFGLMFLATQIVSASSITAAFFYPLVVYAFHGRRPGITIMLSSLFICLFVIAMHKDNIRRLMNKTEKKVTFGKKNKKG